jgi:hypothetical protein
MHATDSWPWDGADQKGREHEFPAAFTGALVNLKNVATHKSVALTVEVPEEHAAALIAAFGWPTRVRPVPVAVARLAGEAAPEAPKERKREHWSEMAPSKQAAILCRDPDFQEYMATKPWAVIKDEMSVEEAVRAVCGVESRSEITRGHRTGQAWQSLMIGYGAWLREKEGG